MAGKKTPWGEPGQTGVSEDGIPWEVPEAQPSTRDRIRRWLSLAPETAPDNTMPAGARYIPARTADEVRERCTRKFAGGIRDLDILEKDETLAGFADCGLDQNVPLPPQTGIDQKAPAGGWWMGGDWDSTAGKLLTSINIIRTKDQKIVSVLYRGMLWVRTSRRVLVLTGNMETPAASVGEYRLDQVGLRPEWSAGSAAEAGTPYRVDIAFADGSWLGVTGLTTRVPGGTEGYPDRELFTELAGKPVRAETLPALTLK
ncbi:MAG: hypothetical protein FWE35_17285 [Streptosporangiales bacterium]|jgi:hypothetical protein|nr:hypothetical protein [Streptosporangiales bacterium]